MAKIQTSALISGIRNSVGNSTFSINRYGPVVRAKVSPIQPRTARQVAVRSAFTTQSQGWDALTDDQRATWVTFAASHPISDVFGNSRILAGNAAYVSANATRAVVGLAPVTTPAASGGLSPAAPASAAAVASTGAVTITTAAQVVSSGWYVVATTPGLRAGATFAGSKQRIGGVIATVDAATTAVAHPATYNPLLAYIATNVVVINVTSVDINGYVISSAVYRVVAS